MAQHTSPRHSIRFVLVTSVNLPLAVLVSIFLLYEYQRQMSERVDEKRAALEEEAKTLLPAIAQLRRHGVAATQQYIDTVCGLMQTEASPGHHIAVRLPSATQQATSHGRASPEMLSALVRAADSPAGRAPFGSAELEHF